MGKTTMLAAAACALALASPAAGGPKEFAIAIEDIIYYPSFIYTDGEVVGFAREVLDGYAADRGYRFTYKSIPMKRILRMMVEDEIGFKFPDNPYWNTDIRGDTKFAYSKPVHRFADGVWVLPEKAGRGPDAIRTLGTLVGFTPFPWQARIDAKETRLTEVSHIDNLLQQVIAGRLDGAYVGVAQAHYRLKAVFLTPEALVLDKGLPYIADHFLLSSVRHPEMIAEFDAWLETNAARVAALKAKYEVEWGVPDK